MTTRLSEYGYVSEPMTLYVPSPAAGGYRMGQVLFMLPDKPSAWKRFWTRYILGWVWEDAT
jgi:hypothetical protein